MNKEDNKLPSVKVNYIYDLFYQVLTIITPFITAPYVSRVLGATGVGIQSYANSVVGYFALFGSLGVAFYGQREVARLRRNQHEISKIFWELFILRGATLLIATIAYMVVVVTDKTYGPYLLMLTMTLLATAMDISWFFTGLENFRIIVIRNSIIKVAGIVLMFAVVKSQSDLLLYVGLTAATGLLGNLSVWFYLPKYLDKIRLVELNIKRHLRETLVYFVPTIATSIYTNLDKVMVGLMTEGSKENGYYEYATQIIGMTKTIFLSMNTVMASRMALLFQEKKYNEIHEHMDYTIDFTMLFGWPITMGLIGCMSDFVPWFLGDEFHKTIILTGITAPLVLIIGVSNCIGAQYLTPSGQLRKSNKVICTGAVVNLVLNLIMIPYFQSAGAAIASVIAEAVITVWFLQMSKEYVNIAMLWKYSKARVLAACVMLVVVIGIGHMLQPTIMCSILQVLLGAVVYLGILYILKDSLLRELIVNVLGKLHIKNK